MTAGPTQRSVAPPARGTRPANRRQLILDAATELFSRNGYAAVGMGDVAEAVAIGPSALYRHFRGKQGLLAAVVGDALNTLDDAITAAEHAQPPDVVHALATVVLQHRGVGVLWQREARQLAPADRAEIQAAVNQLGRRFAAYLHTRRPELSSAQAQLLAWSGLAVATSVSFHGLALPEPAFTTLLGELIATAIDAPIPPLESVSARNAEPPTLRTQSRREKILTEATKLFAANGFSGVSTEDIGASVGIAGPSVYNHFPAKSDILVAAMLRGDEWLRMDMNRAFAAASDPRDGLNRLLGSYCAFVLDNPQLIAVLVSEAGHLPEPQRHRTRAAQYAYIAEWVNLLREVHPQWDAVTARIRVQAAQTMMNDIALVPSVRERTDVESALVTIGTELLATADDSPVR
ncbi:MULTISPECIES: TetR/AcrR family transcriptional regulator [unclassified Mycobacterium]|uniref:TetR/AcrR family transcriptional regulator n=1 Tax=unclassified Mycobacterium TaxID=2642494 RepID=UPI0029C72D3B|nr:MULTISPECIES: TetR/AcrR family transcriptional regulator [unclassified Mycobacterium]